MTTLDKLLDDVASDRANWPLRSIAADYCEDSGDHALAACLRWTARCRKRPYAHGDQKVGVWFDGEKVDKELGDSESDLPGEVYTRLVGGEVKANHRTYETWLDAERAMHAAWREAVRGGWDPDGTPSVADGKAAEGEGEPT